MIDENDIRKGFEELSELAALEYHQSLTDVLADRDTEKVAERVGRLAGVVMKAPFARARELSSPSRHSLAYRSWQLMNEREFEAVAATNPWQYRVLMEIKKQFQPESLTPHRVAEDLAHESGYFGAFAWELREYICGNKEVRKKVDDAVKAAKIPGIGKAPAPETIVGGGGLSLGAYLVAHVPLLAMAGAPMVAAVVVILYVLGVKSYCRWSKNLRTNSLES